MGSHRLCADAHAALFRPLRSFLVSFDRMQFACYCSATTQSATLFECTPSFPRGWEMQSARENTALADCIVRSTAMSCKPRSLTSTARNRLFLISLARVLLPCVSFGLWSGNFVVTKSSARPREQSRQVTAANGGASSSRFPLLAPTRDSFESGASAVARVSDRGYLAEVLNQGFPFYLSLIQCRRGRTRMDEWVASKKCVRCMQ